MQRAQPNGEARPAGLRPGPLIRKPGQETQPAADPCTKAAEMHCLVLLIRCMERNQVVSGSFVSAITVPEVIDQRMSHRVQPIRRSCT